MPWHMLLLPLRFLPLDLLLRRSFDSELHAALGGLGHEDGYVVPDLDRLASLAGYEQHQRPFSIS